MTRLLRNLLTATNNAGNGTSIPVPTLVKTPAAEPPQQQVSAESDFVVVLAALLCAIICAVGLVAVARCAWLRRRAAGNAGRPAGQPNKGLKKKTLQALPKYTYGGSAAVNLSECAICLAEYVDGDQIRILPQCGHGFHLGCIDTWLGSHSSCPSCRQILVVARCHKCGEYPALPVAGAPAGNPAKCGQDRPAGASTSTNFLP